MAADDPILRWVEGTRYFQRHVKPPEWWRSLTPERRLIELGRVVRRLRVWRWVVNLYLAVLGLCVVAVIGFFVDPSVVSVVSGVVLLVLLIGAIALMVRTRRRCHQALRRARQRLRLLQDDASGTPGRSGLFGQPR